MTLGNLGGCYLETGQLTVTQLLVSGGDVLDTARHRAGDRVGVGADYVADR